MSDEKVLRTENRLSICNSCPHKTKLGRCAKCGCIIEAKTACEDCKCPIGEW